MDWRDSDEERIQGMLDAIDAAEARRRFNRYANVWLVIGLVMFLGFVVLRAPFDFIQGVQIVLAEALWTGMCYVVFHFRRPRKKAVAPLSDAELTVWLQELDPESRRAVEGGTYFPRSGSR